MLVYFNTNDFAYIVDTEKRGTFRFIKTVQYV